MTEPLRGEDIRQLETMLREERKLLVAALRDRLYGAAEPIRTVQRGSARETASDERPGTLLLSDGEIAELGLDLRELRAVESALGRIEAGNYGLCIACGAAISGARLRAHPTATLCLACQSDAERRPGAYANIDGNARARL